MPTITDTPFLSPILAGRAEELVALRRWLDGVRDSESSQRVMLIAGEAGMGKSRLVREAKAMAAEHGFDVLQGKSDHVLRTSEVRSTYLRAHISSGGPSVSVP